MKNHQDDQHNSEPGKELKSGSYSPKSQYLIFLLYIVSIYMINHLYRGTSSKKMQ